MIPQPNTRYRFTLQGGVEKVMRVRRLTYTMDGMPAIIEGDWLAVLRDPDIADQLAHPVWLPWHAVLFYEEAV